ncbi:hypothetical protein V491_01090 [Pseudogymnoascus sp. VKM F-3775]|nr:hypothetical protein V491_01090 [Pseudogymnoascus sp. VKM F-3775]
MPVTRSEKCQRASSELSDLPSSNLSQTSEIELSNPISHSKKRSKKLPSGLDATPNNNTIGTPGPKPDTSFTTAQDEPRIRSLRSRSYMTSSNKTDVAHAQEPELGKSLSRSEKRSEQRRPRKLESRSQVSPRNNNTVASALKSELSSYTPQEWPRVRSLRSRSHLSLSMDNTPTPAPNMDMRSYGPQETAPKKINFRSYESSASKYEFSDTMEIISSPYVEVGVEKHLSSSTKKSRRAMRSASLQKDSQRPNKKIHLLMAAAANNVQTPESSGGDLTPRLKLFFKKPDSGPTLSTGNSAPSSEGISTPFSQGTSAQVSGDLSSPLSEELSPLSEDLSSPLSESKYTPSSEGKSGHSSGDKDSPLSVSNSASYSENSVATLSKANPSPYPEASVTPLPKISFVPSSESNYASSPKPQSKKRAAPHSETSTDGVVSTPNPKLRKLSSKAGSDDTMLAEELSPEKQSQYIADREKEPQRIAEQQKLLTTMEQFKKGFQDLMSHIRAPRKNSHNKKNFNEHMFALKLSPQLCLMAPSQRHVGIYMKDACFDSTSQAMTIWVMGLLMEVIKTDGLAWGEIVIEMTEGGSVGKVSNWGFNQGCPHKLDTCFTNTNVEILFCKKTFSATITYHHQWKCVSFTPFFPNSVAPIKIQRHSFRTSVLTDLQPIKPAIRSSVLLTLTGWSVRGPLGGHDRRVAY